jgi:hypothetical protein
MKIKLKMWHLISIEDIQAELQQVLNTPMPADFCECLQKWQKHWDRCMHAQGDYFEDGG